MFHRGVCTSGYECGQRGGSRVARHARVEAFDVSSCPEPFAIDVTFDGFYEFYATAIVTATVGVGIVLVPV